MDIIDQLKKKKLINKDEEKLLREKIKSEGKTPEEIVLDRKIMKEKDLFELKSELTGIPLRGEIEEIPKEALSVLPRESIEFYKMVPLNVDRVGGTLEVGMVYPEDDQAREALNFLARQQRLKPKIFLITLSDFEKCTEEYHEPEREVQKALGKLKEKVGEEEKKPTGEEEYKRIGEEAPIIKMVAVIIRQAVEGGASDIHIEPTKDELRVRYRMDGILYPSLVLPLKVHSAIAARIKILSNLKIDETRLPQDGRFSTVVRNRKIDFRVSTFPTGLGEKVVLRILDPEKALKSLDELGFRERDFKVVNETTKEPYGMILVTGPTGSGKTTTLYSVLKTLNKVGVNIITLEDPIEYFIGGINQGQVRPDIGFTFAKGLRQILRQDPDIIMVGEIRDEETASLAIHAALTGHLVLSTLHTNNAPDVVPRLVDMGIKPFLLPSTLTLTISQRLLRVLCDKCKKKVELTGGEREYVEDRLEEMPESIKKKVKITEKTSVYKPVGCDECNNKGYSGRIGVFEVMKVTDELARVIGEDPSREKILEVARSQGMTLMEEDGLLKALQGVTSLEEVMRIMEE